ncbi:MAG TPA: hypothetical protein VK726_09075 [Acetobacteraceae bacterium]|jgi:hypothetical protein|nr:hypothetical protein [Acetobacteraceae bacterium]
MEDTPVAPESYIKTLSGIAQDSSGTHRAPRHSWRMVVCASVIVTLVVIGLFLTTSHDVRDAIVVNYLGFDQPIGVGTAPFAVTP